MHGSAHSWGIFGAMGAVGRQSSHSACATAMSMSQPVLTLAVLLIRPVPTVVLLVALPPVGDAVPVPTLELVVPRAVRGFCWVFWQGEESPVSHRVGAPQAGPDNTTLSSTGTFLSLQPPSLTLLPPLLCLCSSWSDTTPDLRTRAESIRAWQKWKSNPCNSEMRLQLPRLAGYSSYSHPGNSGKYWVWLKTACLLGAGSLSSKYGHRGVSEAQDVPGFLRASLYLPAVGGKGH